MVRYLFSLIIQDPYQNPLHHLYQTIFPNFSEPLKYMKRSDQLEIAQHAMKTNTINETVKVSIWDCCVVSADACPPLGSFWCNA